VEKAIRKRANRVTPDLVGSLVNAVLNRVHASRAAQRPSCHPPVLRNRSIRVVQGLLDSFPCFFVVALGCSAADSGVGTTFAQRPEQLHVPFLFFVR